MVDLHLPPAYFWSLTMRQFHQLWKRYSVERYRTSAHVIAFIAEMHRNPEIRPLPFQIEEFMPGFEFEDREHNDAVLSGEASFQKARLMVALLGGEDKTAGMNIQIMDRG